MECATVNAVTTRHQRPEAPERNHQAEQKQQMVGAVQDVEESQPDEPQRRLIPARVERDKAGIAVNS